MHGLKYVSKVDFYSLLRILRLTPNFTDPHSLFSIPLELTRGSSLYTEMFWRVAVATSQVQLARIGSLGIGATFPGQGRNSQELQTSP